jgi:hypothetical protein
MKFLIMQFSSSSCYFFPFLSKYSPQHPVLTYLQSMFFPSSQRTKLQAKL